MEPGRLIVNQLARLTPAFVFVTLAMCTALSTARGEAWVSIGPFGMEIPNRDVINGQVNALAVDPRDANIIYVGSAEGGIWKTRDGGSSWIPLTDTQLVRTIQNGTRKGTMSIGALAIDPSKPQTVYAGTGDPNIACCFQGPALGVFRSMDGGASWTPTGADAQKAGCSNAAIGTSVVNRIVIVPGRQSTVFAATSSGVYRYREDGNDCWLNLMNGLPQFGRLMVNDIVADPYQGALYAAYPGQGIFKSDLTGNQWQMLAGGLPTSATGFFRIALAFGGRTGVGFSNPQPIVYAGIAVSNAVYRLFVTRDGGANWSELPSPPQDGQLSFNNVITVGPYSSDEVYIGQIAFHRTLDGGRTGGKNDYSQHPPVTTNSWTVLGCCQTLPNPFRKGLDMHGDIHDIVFAPYGSFLPDPSQVQIVFVATDGGITRGRFDSDGVVTWEPLSKGLAIGQSLAIGLDPNDPTVSVSGFWHNGNAMLLPTSQQTLPFGGGDGATARVDAGVFAVYFDCNAGFGGSLCRAHAPFMGAISSERIWSQSTGGNHWSDPHRPGNLLHLQSGVLFRATGADLAPHAVLANPDSWVAIDPFWGKTGNTVTMAFKSRVLEEQPVYYLGTSTGQVWRGSPEVGWTKLCECGNGAAIKSIGPDLRRNERIFVATALGNGPGRIKQLTQAGAGWNIIDIDSTFAPELSVGQIFTIVVDPAIPETWGTALYVGTDQGVYRGFHGKPIVHPFAVALIPPIGFDNWTWRRSPGVPNVSVAEIQVHQNFQAHDSSGVIRASTYGRGLYELNRTISPSLPLDPRPFAVAVQAIQIGEDGAPPPVPAQITVLFNGERYVRAAPFEFAPDGGAEVMVEAPEEVKTDEMVLRFVGWALPDGKRSSERRIALKPSDAVNVVANYQEMQSIPDKDAKPLRVNTTATARQVCVQNVTHELVLSWDVLDGQRPARVRVEVSYPDRHMETIGLKPIQGTQSFQMSSPTGGTVVVKMVATDSTGISAFTESAVPLEPCAK
jgi:hypothetical protein